MRKLFAFLLLFSALGLAQGVRIGDGNPVSSTLNLAGVGNILTPSATASISICTYPANAVPCTNKATTYTTQALSVACSTSTQVTLPGTSTCVANADAQGEWGAWVAPGSYDFTITVGSHSYGPFTVTNGNVALVANSALKDAIGDKAFVNYVNDCNGITDKVSDICASFTACVAANPNRNIIMPMLAVPGAGFGTPTPQSYYSTCALTINTNGAGIEGMSGTSRYLGGVKIKFASGVGGIVVGDLCSSCSVRNLFLEGTDPADISNSNSYEDYTGVASLTGTGPDGVLINAGQTYVENVRASQFKRHGFHIRGAAAGQPDGVNMYSVMADTNRGCGVYFVGADSNVGMLLGGDMRSNGLCAYNDSSFFGANFTSTHSSHNGLTSLAAGSNKAITAATGLTVASNVLTIATDVPNTWTAGQWVTTTGSTDGTFNGTCKLLTVATSSATCNFTHANGSTGGGTAATSSGTQIKAYYTANSVRMGSYISASASQFNMAYTETAVDGALDLGTAATCIAGGQFNTSAGNTCNGVYSVAGNQLYRHTKFDIFKPLDSGGLMVMRNVADDTNMFQVDVTGAIVALGAFQKFGTTPANAGNGIRLPNNTGVYFMNQAGIGSIRGLFVDTSNITHVGDTVAAAIFDGPASSAGLFTFSAGAKLAASQSFSTIGVLFASTAPTISSGFGTSPTIANTNGTASFTINVGTGGTATSGVVGLPTATTGWTCWVNDLTAAAGHVAYNTRQTASTTTTATLENQTTSTGAAVAWAASDILRVSCFAY
jgi:hypothetical protein